MYARDSVNNWFCRTLFRLLFSFYQIFYYYTFQFMVFTIPFYRLLFVVPEEDMVVKMENTAQE
jgi:hypothetical protein